MLVLHEALVAKICAELKDFDNLYYEVCNEPYFGGVTLPWQERIIAAITAAEAQFPHRHLIARNIANGRRRSRSRTRRCRSSTSTMPRRPTPWA